MLEKMKMSIINKTALPLLKLKKVSPEILLYGGIVGIIGGVALACKATLKISDVIEHKQDLLDTIDDEVVVNTDSYNETMAEKDRVIVKIQTGLEIAKLYVPSAILLTVSIAAITKSHTIMRGRNAALLAAYKVVDEAFASYRERVKDEFGPDKERNIRYAIEEEKVTVEETDPETGKVKKVKKTLEISNLAPGASLYARFFDEYCVPWQKIPEYNLMFLTTQERYWNDILTSRGFVFLNEVYQSLGIDMCSYGQLVGWLKDSPDGDGYISFNIYDHNKEANRDFVNGRNNAILLDFNVDGKMYDMLN